MNISIYVDDLIISGSNEKDVEIFKIYWNKYFHMKGLGKLKYFLGTEVAQNSDGIFLCQRKYALDLISEAGLLGAKLAKTPLEQNHKLTLVQSDDVEDATQYQHLVR